MSTRSSFFGASVLLVAFFSGCSTVVMQDDTKVNLKAGPGVFPDKIAIGSLNDLSGPFAPLGKNISEGIRIAIDEANQEGGVCGKRVELEERDHGLDAGRAAIDYSRLEPMVSGFVGIVGSSVVKAIEDDIVHQQLIAIPAAWSSSLLENPNMMLVGSTYEVDAINGLERVAVRNNIRTGDRIGHIYATDEYGADSLRGVNAASNALGLMAVSTSTDPGGGNIKDAILRFKAVGARVIILSTAPHQTAIAMQAIEAVQFAVPIILSAPAFAPKLLSGFQELMERQVSVTSSIAPFGSSSLGAREVAEAYVSKYPEGTPSLAVDWGYLATASFIEVLKRACAVSDLTRAGLIRARRTIDKFDSMGLSSELRFSVTGRASSTQTFILRPDAASPGGLVVAEGPAESAIVERAVR